MHPADNVEIGEPIEDAELLRRYASGTSEAAFAELVQRHLDLVYAVALRQVGGDTHLAKDVTQVVFTALARKAASLTERPVLGGWLYRTAQFSAIDVVRAERRRRVREQEAQIMHEMLNQPEGETDWEKLRPALDHAIGELKDDDRDAVVLRFFEGKSFAAVGARLRLSENSARMRVERALEKIRATLERRGVTSTAAALGGALASQTSAAVPTGLAAAVTGVALTGAGTAGGGAVLATFMGLTKLQIGLAGAIAVAGSAGVTVGIKTNNELRERLAVVQHARQEAMQLEVENRRLAGLAAEVAALSGGDVELARLRDEAAELKDRIKAAADAEKMRRREIIRAQVAAAKNMSEPSSGPLPDFDPSGPDRLPVIRSRPIPSYPFDMRQDGISGEVTVDFIVDPSGNVQSAHAVKSTRSEFEAAAIEAVSKWKFDPGVKSTRAVPVHMQAPIGFSIPAKGDTKPGWF